VDVVDELKIIVNNYLEEHNSLIPTKKKEPYTLYAEMTPNPQVMKFVSNKMITKGMIELKSKDELDQEKQHIDEAAKFGRHHVQAKSSVHLF
jgi:hypothetical protein